MKQQDNQQEDREQGRKGGMKHKVFIRGADTFPTGEKLFHGGNPPFGFLLFIAILQGERLSSAAADSWRLPFSG